MVTKVKRYVKEQNMIAWGDGIVVGVSGGADSVALLLVLKEMQKLYGLKLYGVHVHHGIRKEADKDAEYVKALCASLGVSFHLYQADIPTMAKEQGLTEEEMGRIYRYQCFCQIQKQVGADKIAVAHHMDDQAETVVFRLVRGSKISGMEGMRPVCHLEMGEGDVTVIRPLLGIRKQELVDWLQCQNVSWQEDVTNADNAYARNAIRNQVIPVLQQVNSKAVEHMAEYAKEMEEVQGYIQCQVQEYVRKYISVGEDMCCKVNRLHLQQQHPILAKSVLYEMLCLVCGTRKDIGSVHVQTLFELLSNHTGKQLSLPYGVEAEIQYEMLKIRKSLQRELLDDDSAKTEGFLRWSVEDMTRWEQGRYTVKLPGQGVLNLHFYQKKQCDKKQWEDMLFMVENSKNNYTKYFGCDTIKDTLCLRTTEKNDYFVMNDSGARKKLSRYFIDAKIPATERKNVLVLANGQEVLWMVGLRRCEAYKVTSESQMVLVVKYKGE